MANNIEAAFERFISLKSTLETAIIQGINESDTRHSVIDRMLFEVFQWEHAAVKTEPPTSSGYIDYCLQVGDGRNAQIIEAKKGTSLKPSTKQNEAMTVSLSGTVAKPLLAAVRQALTYATEKGAPTAVVSDGATWLFFRGSRTDGRPPLDGKAILYPNLTAIEEDFTRFAELLAPTAINDRLNLAHLNDAEGIRVEEAEQQFFVLQPSEASMRIRKPLASDAGLLFSQFFSRLSDDKDREMLRDCFVETTESQNADLELEKIIQKVLNDVSALTTGQENALRQEVERTIASKRSETILLIGNKGSGKSTFIDRFFHQALPLSLREQCVVAHIDLADYHADADPNAIISWAIIRLRDLLEQGACSHRPPHYDDLQGIFHLEYKRWSVGQFKHLYESDKNAFKVHFGQHIEARREKNPAEYVRFLIAWIAKGQGKLPCLIFDNTDQFPSLTQDAIYQLAHSLESAGPVFNVVPITDRSVWRLSKAGALQSYHSRAFYLPVPEAKEIISRRVNFLKTKLRAEPNAAKSYFSSMGFRVELNDLAILAEAVEKIFVDTDYVSGFLGRLGNFDIRRTLRIAERVFLSPDVEIDDIIRSKFGGKSIVADKHKTQRALIKGEYDRFDENENEFVSNLFYTAPQRPTSPLVSYYILWILRQRFNNSRDDSVEARHWGVGDLVDYFEPCGVAEHHILLTLRKLYNRRQIEALDPNTDGLGLGDKVAIKESGMAHLELMLNSTVYIEQMALVTGVNELFVRDEMRRNHIEQKPIAMRDSFLRYILKTDAARVALPANSSYAQLQDARRQIQILLPRPRSRHTLSEQELAFFKEK